MSIFSSEPNLFKKLVREQNEKKYRKKYYEKNKLDILRKSHIYYKKNKKRYSEYNKNYYHKNKKTISKRQLVNRSNADKVSCECGSVIMKYTFQKHLNTKKHKMYLDH